MAMQVWIYASVRHPETYLYVAAEKNFERVPPDLMRHLGSLNFVMDMEIEPGRQLARADAARVISQLRECGYYLQLPPSKRHPEQPLQ